jgi:hypothetical protein
MAHQIENKLFQSIFSTLLVLSVEVTGLEFTQKPNGPHAVDVPPHLAPNPL